MKMSAQDIWKHITHLITLWEDPWSPQNCSKIPKWKMRVVSAWVSRVHWNVNRLIILKRLTLKDKETTVYLRPRHKMFNHLKSGMHIFCRCIYREIFKDSRLYG